MRQLDANAQTLLDDFIESDRVVLNLTINRRDLTARTRTIDAIAYYLRLETTQVFAIDSDYLNPNRIIVSRISPVFRWDERDPRYCVP